MKKIIRRRNDIEFRGILNQCHQKCTKHDSKTISNQEILNKIKHDNEKNYQMSE